MTQSTNIKILPPTRALNSAFRKVKPSRAAIETFKANLTELLDCCNDAETEEFHKNLVIDFLKKTYYEPRYSINTKGRNDLVIHNGERATSTVGVILEVKRPTNKAEMLTKERINVKVWIRSVTWQLPVVLVKPIRNGCSMWPLSCASPGSTGSCS